MVCKLIPANCWESDSRRSLHQSPRGTTADASQYVVWIPTRWTGKGYRKLWFVKSTHCFLCVFFFFLKLYFAVQSLSRVLLFVTPWTAARQASLFINSWSLLKLVSIESVMPSNHLILCCPLLLLSSIFPGIRVFSNESALSIRWPKYWSFSFSISPSNEQSGLISFRMDWFDFLAVQGTLKSLFQHHSSKLSVFI